MSDIRSQAFRAAEELAGIQGTERARMLLLRISAMKPVAYITPDGMYEVNKNGKATVFKPGHQPYKECYAMYLNQ